MIEKIKEYYRKNRILVHIVVLLIIAEALVVGYILTQQKATYISKAQEPPTEKRIIGGFRIESPDKVASVAVMNINTAFLYGNIAANIPLLNTLAANNIQIVDGGIWNYLNQYECYRIWQLFPDLADGYCPQTRAETTKIRDEASLAASVSAYLDDETIANSPSILGFWIVDDWPTTLWKSGVGLKIVDPGGAKPHLERIHALVVESNLRHGTNRKTFCGFAANIGIKNRLYDGWNALRAKNFTPNGCDMIAVYSYAPLQTPALPNDIYDWEMVDLEIVKSDLQKEGWDSSKTPLLGIAQAFGGAPYYVIPRGQDVATQSAGFCSRGASGIIYYAFNVTSMDNTHTPLNDPEIAQGVKDGIDACKNIWSGTVPTATPSPSPTPSLTPTPTLTTLTLFPQADSYVKKLYPNQNFGKTTILRVDGVPVEITYLKFNLTSLAGKPISSAKLRIKISNGSSSTQNIKIAENNWYENGITYKSRPSSSTAVNSFSNITAGVWKEIDVTSAVRSKAGGILSFSIDSIGANDLVIFSRESINKPSLVVIY